jgi:alginate O-acetyltransferase complex protein AlgJ
MLNASSLRYRYTQFFVLFMFCTINYVMVQSISSGVTNFQNNLYKKDFLIGQANSLRIKIGDRVLPVALLGKDGWEEYTGDGNIDDFQNLKQFKNKNGLLKKLIIFNQYLKSQGITLLIVVSPNKATIYPDKLPEQIKSLPTQSRLDRLISSCSEDENLPVVVDLRPALRTARQDQDVYYKENDTHWNGYGAFIAYTAIINALKSSYPELKPYEAADLELVAADPSKAMPGFFFTPKKLLVQTLHPGKSGGYNQFSSIQDSKLPTLLMFHDSQGAHYLNNYLSMNFRKSYFIHLFSSPQYLSKKSIPQFKPDIIIIEIIERNLEQLDLFLSNFVSEKGF